MLVTVLPGFVHAEDGAEAAKRFQERNKAVFAQQAKDRAERESRALQAGGEDARNVHGSGKTDAAEVAE